MAAPWSKLAAANRRIGWSLLRRGSCHVKLYVCQWPASLPETVCSHGSNACVHRRASTSSTPKKDCSLPLAKAHDPEVVEAGWYEWWMQQGFFTPSNHFPPGDKQKIFAILLPPPNVTGNLHLGHALTGAIQDAIVRWHRMKGYRTVWIPGTDHAGIATHAVVERKIWKEQGKSRHDLGREEFVKEIWKWKGEHGHTITEQMKTLGLSLDWSREYFTMDERLSSVVAEAFCRLYEKGLVYRDKRMINWSCALRSSISDIEVDRITLEKSTKMKVPGVEEEVECGVLCRFAYPVVGSDEVIIVATTRLETMLADTAVAVHPDDPRYAHLIGKRVEHLIDKGRQLPIIADSFVDPKFGTGAVKITPGHDHVDFEVGRRHNLPILEILNDDGTIKEDVPLVGGQDRFTARKNLREALCLLGYYYGEKDHGTVLPVCSRSGDIVEARLKEQWFMDCSQMAQAAMEVVESGQLKMIPEYNTRIWWEWLNNTQDWCLSRQLWWGHRVPVYTCTNSKKRVCAVSEEEAKKKLAAELGVDVSSVSVSQDEDVLDTWFSSALLPFSTLGWPEQEHVLRDKSSTSSSLPQEALDLQHYFPQQLMETGQDILFFWVARMVMLSLELTKTLPFKEVLLHGMLRDAQGRKMSKSLGNVIDPLDVIKGATLQDLAERLEQGNLDKSEIAVAKEGQRKSFPEGIAQCGADALRFTLCSYNVKNVDINFDVSHAESRRRFCNKIWQSFKFIMSKLPPDLMVPGKFELSGVEDGTDLWILSRLSHMIRSCDSCFQTYDLHLVTSALQQFWYQELCDVYLEAVKPVFLHGDKNRQDAVAQILLLCAQTFVRAAAPFMPYLCEELYQRLPESQLSMAAESVCVARYPMPEEYPWHNADMDSSMEVTLDIVHQIQKLRKEYQIMATRSHAFVQTNRQEVFDALSRHKTCLLALSRSGDLTVTGLDTDVPSGYTTSYITSDLTVAVELIGSTVDVEKELERLTKKMGKMEEQREEWTEKLGKMEAKGKGQHPKAVKIKKRLSVLDQEMVKLSEMKHTISTSAER